MHMKKCLCMHPSIQIQTTLINCVCVRSILQQPCDPPNGVVCVSLDKENNMRPWCGTARQCGFDGDVDGDDDHNDHNDSKQFAFACAIFADLR